MKSVRTSLFLATALVPMTASVCRADFVTATYAIEADNFQDSNSNPPISPSTTTVRGQFSFTFDRLNSQDGIMPDSVQGIEIRDNNGVLHIYDGTNSGVDTNVNQFLDFARITFGGNVNTPSSMAGLSDDFRVIFDIDTTMGDVTNIQGRFSYVSTVDPFYTAQATLVLLSAYDVMDADLDDDTDVDGRDFLLIQRNNPSLIPQWETEYGAGVGPLAHSSSKRPREVEASQAVPEPSSILIAIAFAGIAPFACLRRDARA